MSSMTRREVGGERPVCPTCGAPAGASVSDGPRMGGEFAVYQCVPCDRIVEIDASFDVSWTTGDDAPTVRTVRSAAKPTLASSD
ncbi:hypothetical protein SAMN04488063_2290 [Halopelagius inordinatus]|uniref:Uncharacterized protein n=1 Tax=Halopelagius inordinatus TaxID=553467 RepID=A0A1I2SGR2_9EURY|nr:hypothetical protein [Halopelagius inordinatus]SFG51922.1 hypothetical protein SAMN04488063_2290 [Halopelagius inordinatus]